MCVAIQPIIGDKKADCCCCSVGSTRSPLNRPITRASSQQIYLVHEHTHTHTHACALARIRTYALRIEKDSFIIRPRMYARTEQTPLNDLVCAIVGMRTRTHTCCNCVVALDLGRRRVVNLHAFAHCPDTRTRADGTRPGLRPNNVESHHDRGGPRGFGCVSTHAQQRTPTQDLPVAV